MVSSSSGFIGYINYVVLLFIITGILLLYFDVTGYGIQGMKKEQKVSRVLGWLNICLGGCTFVGNWIYQNLFQ